MRLICAVALTLCVVGCSAAPVEEPRYEEAHALVDGICDEWGVSCVGVTADELGGFEWARYKNYGPCGAGRLWWDIDRCARELDLCEAVVMHEIGHYALCTNDEYEADAWVVENGTEEQIASLIYLLCARYDGQTYRCTAVQDRIEQHGGNS